MTIYRTAGGEKWRCMATNVLQSGKRQRRPDGAGENGSNGRSALRSECCGLEPLCGKVARLTLQWSLRVDMIRLNWVCC